MVWKSSEQTAKEAFKNLVVDAIKDIKNFYNNLQYQQFINAVNILDCLLESYKEDPFFKSNSIQLLTAYRKSEDDLKKMMMMQVSEDTDEKMFKEMVKLFQAWFRLLVDLANRTVFSGKMMNVDIDLEEVLEVWNAMREIPLKKEDLEKKINEEAEMAIEPEIGISEETINEEEGEPAQTPEQA